MFKLQVFLKKLLFYIIIFSFTPVENEQSIQGPQATFESQPVNILHILTLLGSENTFKELSPKQSRRNDKNKSEKSTKWMNNCREPFIYYYT